MQSTPAWQVPPGHQHRGVVELMAAKAWQNRSRRGAGGHPARALCGECLSLELQGKLCRRFAHNKGNLAIIGAMLASRFRPACICMVSGMDTCGYCAYSTT